MGLESLVFNATEGEAIFSPQELTTSTPIEVTITNLGTDDLEELGLYVWPADITGSLSQPDETPPETSYQDLIRWGEETEQEVALAGGLILTVPQNEGDPVVAYVTRQAGSTMANKIPMADLSAGESITIGLEIETPTGVSARRLYISLKVDTSI